MFAFIGTVSAEFIVGVIAKSIMPGKLGFKAIPCLHP